MRPSEKRYEKEEMKEIEKEEKESRRRRSTRYQFHSSEASSGVTVAFAGMGCGRAAGLPQLGKMGLLRDAWSAPSSSSSRRDNGRDEEVVADGFLN